MLLGAAQLDGTFDYTVTAVDAAGNESTTSGAIRVTIDTLGPLQAFRQVSKLFAADGAANDFFGRSVSISGTTAIIGADRDDDRGTDSGSAYVLEDMDAGSIQVAKLTASDGAEGDCFGADVAISGNTAIVGAYRDDDRGVDSGSAYVFQNTGSGWIQIAKLTAGDGETNDRFGGAVAISGNMMIVGAGGDDDGGSDSGSVYVFENTPSGWAQVAKLTAGDAAADDWFGSSVAISGATAIVGAYRDDDRGGSSGSAYVFEHTASGWTQVAKLLASDGSFGDDFGYDVSISGATAIVGAYIDSDLADSCGSAYVFDYSESGWTQVAKLAPDNPEPYDNFGYSVSISGNTAVVGAYHDDDRGSSSGSVYVYRDSGSGWQQASKVTASDGSSGDCFGSSVAINGDRAIVGAYRDSVLSSYSGSAYLFEPAARLNEDSGVSLRDRTTSDTTPELTVWFTEAVYGQNDGVTVLDPNDDPVTSDEDCRLGKQHAHHRFWHVLDRRRSVCSCPSRRLAGSPTPRATRSTMVLMRP